MAKTPEEQLQMSSFKSSLTVSPLSDGGNWVLKNPFTYCVDESANDDPIEVERGFSTDFASIPRPLWFVLPKWGKYGNAAVVHDYLYWSQGRSRAEADAVMLEAMKILDVPGWQRAAIYGSVRLFGWLAWKHNQLNREQGFNRVIDLDAVELDASYEHRRPRLIESMRAVRRAPSSREQIIARRPDLEGSVLALAGLKVRHGDVIDAIEPIFAEIAPDLSIVSQPRADRIGGEGGEATVLLREGCLVTGFPLVRGLYFGRHELIHLEVVWCKLTPDGLEGPPIVSERLGSGNYAKLEQPLEKQAQPGHYISDLEAFTSDHTSGETFVHHLDFVERPLPGS